MTEELRTKDQVVLECIQQGHDDIQKITAETTLENHHVNYCFDKLQQKGLITISNPDGMVERVIDGQKRVFQHPKQARLTDKAQDYLENTETEDTDEYQNLTHRELVQQVKQLDNKVAELEQKFEIFKKQIQKRL